LPAPRGAPDHPGVTAEAWEIKRIVLVDMSRLLRGIVRGVLSIHRDMRVVREVEDEQAVISAVDETDANFVIWGVDGGFKPTVCELFDRFPRVRVIAIEGDGRDSFLYELRPIKSELGQLSGDRLVDAIRVAAT
jgi:DNA-binding NarL/FixJ family response regulator